MDTPLPPNAQGAEETSDTLPSVPSTGAKGADKELWLNAWRDHLAGLKAFSNCIELADINGDGEYKLLVADASRRLKVFSNTSLVSESPLLDIPSGLASFYMDYRDEVRRPNVAVSTGPYIFIYKNLRPFFRFNLPPVELSQQELDVWAGLKQGRSSIAQAVETLEAAKDGGVQLSTRSMDLVSLEKDEDRAALVESTKNTPLVQQTVISAMAVLNKDREEPGSLGCLVVGTENGRLLILDATGSIINKKILLPSVAVHIVASGLYDVEYRIFVGCRNGNVYCVKNGELLGVVIEVDAQPVGLARVDNSVVVATMSNAVHFYHVKGKKQFSIYLPAPITNLCPLYQESIRATKSCIVALANGEVRVYTGKALINKVQVHDVVTAMKFGRYGREDSTLVLVMKSGSILLKMLPRTASLEANKASVAGPPPEQDVPLKIPKKTKLYVEQTQREKDFGVDMHRVFQRDLCKLRLQTARAYVRILTDGQGSSSFQSDTSIRLTAHVQGLGPLFKIKLNVQNTGARALTNIPVFFTYNMDIYSFQKPSIMIPALVPSLVYNFEVPVECVDEEAGSDVIRVYVLNPASNVPIITALVNMPLADFLMNQQ